MVIDITVNGTADWWYAAAGASGHSSLGSQHNSSSNFNSYEQECRGPARTLPSHQEITLVHICRIRMRLYVVKSLNDMYMSNNF